MEARISCYRSSAESHWPVCDHLKLTRRLSHSRKGELCADSNIEPEGICPTLSVMAKAKIPATGEGYLGEIMVHRLTRAIGVVESVTEATAGWPPQLTLKVKDGTVKQGKLSDFREPSATEREKYSVV